ncbi:MAG: NADH-quinone oxidoreductase subunit L, partial [Bacteroidia bacterium]|nr:NADH-quinone oxidoreductase subunit L [Bacteroidia bacterium]
MVGLSSYLLIGFWYGKLAASRAARKAFLVNRLGDAGFLIAIFFIYHYFGTLELSALPARLEAIPLIKPMAQIPFTLLGLGLFCGVMAKSAQFPLHIWLPDAMEGPTPVSALIHAATMVAAGVYLLARVFFLINIQVFVLIAFIGGATAFLGAFTALVQKDIKRVLAYSTISQLGYMVMGMGVGAYDASLFHLFTHAFFKASLFLGAGAIIHTMHETSHEIGQDFDPQNIYMMGGLRRKMPFTFACFTLSALALVGLPFSSGFLSKDAILSAAWAWAPEMAQSGNYIYYLVPLIAFASVFLTALYIGRMLLLVFFGPFHPDRRFRRAPDGFPKIH